MSPRPLLRPLAIALLLGGAVSGLSTPAHAEGAVCNMAGVLYDATEPRDLRRALESVVADKHRALLGARGRELALTRSWTAAVDDLVATLHDVVGARVVS